VVKERDYQDIKDIQEEGVYIHGLYLEASRWVDGGLKDPEPKSMFDPLPILYVTVVNKSGSSGTDQL